MGTFLSTILTIFGLYWATSTTPRDRSDPDTNANKNRDPDDEKPGCDMIGPELPDSPLAPNIEIGGPANSQAARSARSSNIIDKIQNVYLPAALQVTSAVQDIVPRPSPPDFWEVAKKYENVLQDYVPRLLGDAASYCGSTRFMAITSCMHNIVSATATFRVRIQGALDTRHVTLGAFTEELERIFTGVVHNLEKIPLLEHAPGHVARAEVVDMILGEAARALMDLGSRYGVDEQVVSTYLVALTPQVRALIVAVGDINEQHPKLLSIVTFSIAGMLLPEFWMLKPFLSLFGFGPSGPIKGSAAAWMQRYFWGGAVKAGSWFSLLQAAGMGKFPVWAGLVTNAVPSLVKDVLSSAWIRFRRGA